jgi:hypothetical protein
MLKFSRDLHKNTLVFECITEKRRLAERIYAKQTLFIDPTDTKKMIDIPVIDPFQNYSWPDGS